MLANHQRKIEIKFQIMFDEKKNVDEKTISYTSSHVHTELINDKYLMFDNTGNVTFAVGATSIL